MKKSLIVVGCVALLQFATAESSSAHQRVSVSFGAFYSSLSPYGEWISIGGGVYGWQPSRIAAGWRPYTVGRWAWTADGWYWVSDEPWGWAAYHYGRWHYDDYYGWIWIPGYDWAPAWVEWRYGDDYIGWAPLSPYAVFSVSWGIHYRTRWYTPSHWWIFAGCGHMTSPSLHRYIYRPEHNTRYIGVTRTGGSVRHSGGRIVTRGPEREFVERRGNVRIQPVRIREVEENGRERIVREGAGEQIEVYRPRIEDLNGNDERTGRPERIRSEEGRAIDLDTRKIDVRSREVAREEGRDINRAEEYRTRNETGRSEVPGSEIDRRSTSGMLKGSVDDAIRNRQERTGSNSPDRRGDDSRNVERRQDGRDQQRPADVRKDVNENRRPEQKPSIQRDASERQKNQRAVSPVTPQRRQDIPSRSSDARNSGSTRTEGGRGGRGR